MDRPTSAGRHDRGAIDLASARVLCTAEIPLGQRNHFTATGHFTGDGVLWVEDGETTYIRIDGPVWTTPLSAGETNGHVLLGASMEGVGFASLQTGQIEVPIAVDFEDPPHDMKLSDTHLALLFPSRIDLLDLHGQRVETIALQHEAFFDVSDGQLVWGERTFDDAGPVTHLHGAVEATVRGHVQRFAHHRGAGHWVAISGEQGRPPHVVFGNANEQRVHHLRCQTLTADEHTLVAAGREGAVWLSSGNPLVRSAELEVDAVTVWDGFPIALSRRRVVPLGPEHLDRSPWCDERVEELDRTVAGRNGFGGWMFDPVDADDERIDLEQRLTSPLRLEIAEDENLELGGGHQARVSVRVMGNGRSVIGWTIDDPAGALDVVSTEAPIQWAADDRLHVPGADAPSPTRGADAARLRAGLLRTGRPFEKALWDVLTDDELLDAVGEQGFEFRWSSQGPDPALNAFVYARNGDVLLYGAYPHDRHAHVVRWIAQEDRSVWLAGSIQAWLHTVLPDAFAPDPSAPTAPPDWFRQAHLDPVMDEADIQLLRDPAEQERRLVRAGAGGWAGTTLFDAVRGHPVVEPWNPGTRGVVMPAAYIRIEDRVDLATPHYLRLAATSGVDPSPLRAFLSELRQRGPLFERLVRAQLHLTGGEPTPIGTLPLFEQGPHAADLWSWPAGNVLGVFQRSRWGGPTIWLANDLSAWLERVREHPEEAFTPIDPAPAHFACIHGDVAPPTEERRALKAFLESGLEHSHEHVPTVRAIYESLGWDAFVARLDENT